MLRSLSCPNPMWSGLTDWEGLTKGKHYWVDSNIETFVDDLGNPRTQAAWLFHIIEERPKRKRSPIQTITVGNDPTQNDDPLVNPKKAAGAVKAPMHTIPPLPMIQANNVMAGGNHKYGLYNYRESQIDAMTYIGAIKRHFDLWQDGEDLDPESQQNHLAHLIADCAILLDCQIRDQLIDNRKKTGLLALELVKSQKTFQHFIENNPSLEERNANISKTTSA